MLSMCKVAGYKNDTAHGCCQVTLYHPETLRYEVALSFKVLHYGITMFKHSFQHENVNQCPFWASVKTLTICYADINCSGSYFMINTRFSVIVIPTSSAINTGRIHGWVEVLE